ncbi:MAG TPA: hypothetical protein VMG41_17715 [Gemmatimonadales bacterium]|nr:hypothetical protein [Gemmatimonadales bacterium]
MIRWFISQDVARARRGEAQLSEAGDVGRLLAQVRFEPRLGLEAEILGASRRSLRWAEPREDGIRGTGGLLFCLPLGVLVVGLLIYLLWRSILWPGR